MTDPNTIDKAVAWIATAEAGVLDAYRVAVIGTYGADSAFVRGVMPAIEARRVELMREQQKRRGRGPSTGGHASIPKRA